MAEERASYRDLTKLIRAFGDRITHSGPQTSKAIQGLASMFDLVLPSDYRKFLGNYGSLSIDNLHIFGLGELEMVQLSIASAILMLRLAHPDMPLELVPIERIDDRHYACLVCNPDEAPVVLVDVDDPLPLEEMPSVAPDFVMYIYNRLLLLIANPPQSQKQATPTSQALATLRKHVEDYHNRFQYDHAKGGMLPRNHDWRPYRYCIQDVVFGIVVVRHHRDANCLQVDVFLTAHIPEYEPLSGERALAAFLLSESYKCGGTMEIRFTGEVEDGQVPQGLQELADLYGIQFRQANSGRIEPDEAKALYAALTRFPSALQERINKLEAEGRMHMARACYVVHHGVWTKEQVEMLVLGSELADMILDGSALPPQRHLYRHSLLHARAALMGGMLDRILAQRERTSGEGIPYDMEDDLRPLNIQFDGENYAKTYRCPEPIPVPWLYPHGPTREFLPDVPFKVLVRARTSDDLRIHLERDIQQAAQMRTFSGEHPTFVLVPYDFARLPEPFQRRRQEQARSAGIGLLICPETTQTFDSDAAAKLAQSRVLRK